MSHDPLSPRLRALSPGLWADALLCKVFPHAGRWTAVVVDRVDKQEHPMTAVRFRYRSHAAQLVEYYRGVWDRRGVTVLMEPRPIERGVWEVVIVGLHSGHVASLGEILMFDDWLKGQEWCERMNAEDDRRITRGISRFELRRIA